MSSNQSPPDYLLQQFQRLKDKIHSLGGEAVPFQRRMAMRKGNAASRYFQRRYQPSVFPLGAAGRTLNPGDARPLFGTISHPQPIRSYVVFELTSSSALGISPLPYAKFALVPSGKQVLHPRDVRKRSVCELVGVLHRSLVWPPLCYVRQAGAGRTKGRCGQKNLPVESMYNLGRSIGQA